MTNEHDSARKISVGVLGLGQIGGSICAALSSSTANWQVMAYDPNRVLCDAALSRSMVERIAFNETELIESSHIVILATHIDVIFRLMTEHADRLRGKLLVTDVGSVKTEICRMAEGLELHNFIGAHPIAGTEKTPPEAWDGSLFAKARYLCCLTEKTSTDTRRLFEELIAAIDARPEIISPRDNDHQFGLTIGLPHVLAYTLVKMKSELERSHGINQALAGPSYNSATRVAKSDNAMVQQMLWHNRRDLALHLHRFEVLIAQVRVGLEGDSKSSLENLIGGAPEIA